MTEVILKPNLHPAQLEVHKDTSRFRVLSAGRRFGKTRLAGTECIQHASAGRRVWWIAPSYKVGLYGWRLITSISERIPGAQIRLQDRCVIFPTRGEIWIKSAEEPNSLRGEGLDFVILEEASWLKEEVWSNVIRPALSDRLGKALFISTPNGRNWFYDLFLKGIYGENGWKSFKYSTYDNPYIDRNEIEEAKEELPDLIFQQEYLAEFVDLSGQIFRNVKECAVLEPEEPKPEGIYVGGLDVASTTDWTVLTIMELNSRAMVQMDRFRRMDYPMVVERVINMCRKYHVTSLVVEINGVGRTVADFLKRNGIHVLPFTTTSSTKQQIIVNLSMLMESGGIRILNNSILIGELLSFTSRKLNSGLFQYSAPEGMHDDCVMSLALACFQVHRQQLVAKGWNG